MWNWDMSELINKAGNKEQQRKLEKRIVNQKARKVK